MQASLFVRKVKLMPSVFLAHAKTLERGTAKYPIRRVVCKSFTVPQNYLDVTVFRTTSHAHSHRTSEQPGVQRAPDEQPVQFPAISSLNEIALYLDGIQQHAVRPIQPNYEMEQYIFKSIRQPVCRN